MSEEQVQENQTEEQMENPINTIEDQAREMGWKPQEEYSGDPKKWVSAEIYVARAPLYEELERRGRELKEIKNVVHNLASHNANIEKKAYENALKTLKAQHRQAVREQEFEIADQIEDRIDELKEEQATQSFKPPQPNVNPVLEDWARKNTWFNTDQEMTEYANFVGRRIMTSNVPMEPEVLLKQVTMEVKERFPEKFGNPRRQEAPAVNGRNGQTKPASKKDDIELTEEEAKVVKQFVKMGIMTEAEYKAQLKAMRN